MQKAHQDLLQRLLEKNSNNNTVTVDYLAEESMKLRDEVNEKND